MDDPSDIFFIRKRQINAENISMRKRFVNVIRPYRNIFQPESPNRSPIHNESERDRETESRRGALARALPIVIPRFVSAGVLRRGVLMQLPI